MLSKDISLRGLEVFEVISRTGSVARTAEETGLSLPAVSQQLRNLEDAVGQALVDHSRRPMTLTAAGRMFQRRTEELLRQLRRALAEATVLELAHVPQLRLGVIDDFDNTVTPELTGALAAALVDCEFRLHTRPSHELAAMVASGQIDAAIGASVNVEGLDRMPLMTDPYVMVVPQGHVVDPADPMATLSGLPFLRYDREQMIGQQIELQLARNGLRPRNRFELDSNPALHALVAQGSGWAITTMLGCMRTRRFHERVDVHPLPFEGFSRTISLMSASGWLPGAASELAQTIRGLLHATVMIPARERFPWIARQIEVLEA